MLRPNNPKRFLTVSTITVFYVLQCNSAPFFWPKPQEINLLVVCNFQNLIAFRYSSFALVLSVSIKYNQPNDIQFHMLQENIHKLAVTFE
jgi:hypothetical protein